MRNNWKCRWLLSLSVLGSTALGSAGTHAQQYPAVPYGAQPQPKTSWTQKVTGVFTGNKSGQKNSPSAAKSPSKLDPISLGFKSGPPNAQLYLSMAKMSDQGGNSAHARSMYHKALTLQPENLEGMLALARLEDREGQLDAALHYYLQAVKMHPQSAKALNDLSLCYARRGQLAQAVPPLEQAIRLEPSKQLYRNNIAKVLVELNQIDGALQHLSAVHAPAAAQYNMGVLLHQRGRNDEAVHFLAAATQTDPSLSAAHTLMAQLATGTRQFAQGQLSQGQQASNDHILPTPQTTPYPTTGAVSASPAFQTVPAETARMPVGAAPKLMPPVR